MKKLALTALLAVLPFQARAGGLFSGTYDMKIQIGEREFHDVLVLESDSGHVHPIAYAGKLTGTVTVPGVFSSPLTGSVRCHPWSAMCVLNFEIIARENGREFKVRYQGAAGYEERDFTGRAFLENGEVLGDFTATRTGR